MMALLEGLKALGPARLAAMGVVAIGVLGLLAMLVGRGGGGDQMALLYGDLDLRDSAQVVEQLNRRHIRYRVAAGGAQILVPIDQVPDTRLLLAREGLPSGGSIGYEIFDRGDNLAFSEFQQKINETRALEGELARSIRAIRGVRQARVHLVLPRREPFARERQDAQASVLLTMTGSQRLDSEAVQAILNLISAAVPGLRQQNIAVVDARGDLLARAGQPTTPMSTAMSGDEVRRTTELRLARAVEEMLERSLGPGHVRAEASVRMNFERLNETQERFDPDGQVVRSAQNVTSSSKSTEQAAAVSVQNNLPNPDAGGQGTGSQESRQEETTNYEISKTVRTIIRDQPQIERVTLAVMVDGIETAGADGKLNWQPRPQEELTRITSLVKSAVGYDEKRGDIIEVASMRFAGPQAAPTESAGLFGLPLEKADLLRLAETALFGLIGLLGLLLVVRPTVARLTSIGAVRSADGSTVTMVEGPDGTMVPVPASVAGGVTLAGGAGGGGGAPEDEAMVDIAQIEGQMRASLLRKLSDLVERHPDETLTIMRGWMAVENG